MATYSHDVSDNIGGMGFGGGGGWLLGGLIIFLLIFKDGFFGHRGGEHHGGGGDRDRNRSWFPDIGNWEQEAHLDAKFCKLDQDIRTEGNETRSLITQNVIQDLRDKNAEKAATIAKLESEGFTYNLFNRLEGQIAALACGLPKARPQYAATAVPCLGEMPRCGEPRRGGCDFID